MNADIPFRLINYISNKFMGGDITGNNYMDIINQAQRDFLNDLLGQFVSYQYGRPISRVQFGMNEIVRQRITPLIDTPSPLVIDATGLAPYPTDFQQVDAIYTSTKDRVRFVPQHKLYAYLGSVIDPVATNPIFLIENEGFRFYPNTNTNGVALSGVTLSYVKTPPAIIWNSTPDAQGRPAYTSAGSQGPVFYDVDTMELVSRSLAMVGINLQANEVSRYAEMVKKEGA